MNDAASPQSQFRLSSLFWVTTAAAMVLAYARSFGMAEVRLGVTYAVFVLLAATTIGSLTRAWGDAYYWSILVTLLAFIAVAGYPMPNREVAYGWGLVGAGCGALHGSRWPQRFWLAVIIGAIFAVALLSLCVAFAQQRIPNLLLQFDMVSAAIIGGALRPFVEVIDSMQQRSRLPRIVIAAWLTSCMVVGKAFVH